MLMSARLGIQITVVVLVRKLEVVFLTLFVYCTNAVSSDVSMILLVDSRQWVRCLEALSANCSSPMAVMKRVYVCFSCVLVQIPLLPRIAVQEVFFMASG